MWEKMQTLQTFQSQCVVTAFVKCRRYADVYNFTSSSTEELNFPSPYSFPKRAVTHSDILKGFQQNKFDLLIETEYNFLILGHHNINCYMYIICLYISFLHVLVVIENLAQYLVTRHPYHFCGRRNKI